MQFFPKFQKFKFHDQQRILSCCFLQQHVYTLSKQSYNITRHHDKWQYNIIILQINIITDTTLFEYIKCNLTQYKKNDRKENKIK